MLKGIVSEVLILVYENFSESSSREWQRGSGRYIHEFIEFSPLYGFLCYFIILSSYNNYPSAPHSHLTTASTSRCPIFFSEEYNLSTALRQSTIHALITPLYHLPSALLFPPKYYYLQVRCLSIYAGYYRFSKLSYRLQLGSVGRDEVE
tara:strand:+ start:50 stop:496 length:447 start_codon:yes stop_codon:yes gene_type:complete